LPTVKKRETASFTFVDVFNFVGVVVNVGLEGPFS
jgi:hypothetical protein